MGKGCSTVFLGAGAKRLCLVASGRGPAPHELEQVAKSVEAVKTAYPDLEVCACLGLLSDGQAERLKAAGVGTDGVSGMGGRPV